MNITELDYELPQRLIAQQGSTERAGSRLMVLDRNNSSIRHQRFSDIADYLHPGDCLVINDTEVIPARFFIRRATGGRIEGLFLKLSDNGYWHVLLKNASRLRINETVALAAPHQQCPGGQAISQSFTVIENCRDGNWLLQPNFDEGFLDTLNRYGVTPLPPYIRRDSNNETEKFDRDRYQTVYADKPGSVAAPTAGLHFSKELLETIQAKGVEIARVTLHVGLGTFKPITSEKVEDHKIHSEFYQLDMTNAQIINRTMEQGSRIVAVGTTSVRTLETISKHGQIQPGSGWTNLFITPGFQFHLTGVIITNFHLPRTSLLALVCAFAGTDRIMAAYRSAIDQEYRFYSYGDAMLIL